MNEPHEKSGADAGKQAEPGSGDVREPAEDAQDAREREARRSLSLWEMITTTLWAVLGVQSSRNRERDFTRGKATHFIVAGILFTAAFVVLMILLVNLILSGVG